MNNTEITNFDEYTSFCLVVHFVHSLYSLWPNTGHKANEGSKNKNYDIIAEKEFDERENNNCACKIIRSL
jgi:hypothetical protein